MATYMGQFQIDNGDVLPVASTLYGTCSTGGSSATKTVTCANFDQLITGVAINVKFSYANSATSPTLNVNGTGAKPQILGTSLAPDAVSWSDGAIVTVVYDGTSWCIAGDNASSQQDYEVQGTFSIS